MVGGGRKRNSMDKGGKYKQPAGREGRGRGV